ncbi:MAG: hypothetical protein AAGF57_05100 [Pseudomonadota bacterium]
MRKYRVIAVDDSTVTYEQNALCNYWHYGSLVCFILGFLPNMSYLSYLAFLGLASYYLIVYFPSVKDTTQIASAMRRGKVKVTGSRWSLSHPQTFVVAKSDE